MTSDHTQLFYDFLQMASFAIEAGGVFIIIVGALVSTARFFISALDHTGEGFGEAFPVYRARMGLGILLGLEFLVAADIIGTVVIDPTWDSVGVLAVIVAIRTFLSFTLELEIHGRWPWQKK